MNRLLFWRDVENLKITWLLIFILLVFFILFKPQLSSAQTVENLGPLPFLDLHTESVSEVTDSSAKVIWFTSHKATSKILYGTKSIQNNQLKLDDNYGYEISIETTSNNVTYHKIILDNLEPNTTYYLRAISLPDKKQWPTAKAVLGKQLTFTTDGISSGTGGPIEDEDDIKKTDEDKDTDYPRPEKPGQVLGDDIEKNKEDQGQATTTEIELEEPHDEIQSDAISTEQEKIDKMTFKDWGKELFWWIVLALSAGILVYAWPEKKA